MDDKSESSARSKLGHRFHGVVRLIWLPAERRPRASIRLIVAFLLFLVLAGAGNQYQPRPITGNNAIGEVINMLTAQLPNALGLGFAVIIAAILVDRRRITDLGLEINRQWWRGLAGGTLVGAGVTLLAIIVGLRIGYYELTGVGLPTGLGVWVVVAVGGALFQLLFVVPEELFVRGYIITNITEGLDGVPSIPRGVAAAVGIAVSSLFFYQTHTVAKGAVYGSMVGVISILLGLGYVLSGKLSVPIGIHFGFNFAGVLAGSNPQYASLIELTAATTVQESLVFPLEAVLVRLVGAVIGIAVVAWWYHATRDGIHVVPEIASPALRWKETQNTTNA
ncbi:CPBP family intramembrane metalloprotease [Halobellus sp. Atlit-38R]|uniref:CPBP family intramembrane glutamic endopeptidase n=1 Tax=Halobellus sp. Atlit-38R TaxID=2282131 RepID=UPI000EF20C26|nr:CPBP family intramembrane glutamic endopeptidase [Halobellus sp. Atlit-38R]RLM89556.1 CPBP family intramembrane metalloprotease [Halobellus sp. Atlit-38R]